MESRNRPAAPSKPRLYLDIDGVLLTKRNTRMAEGGAEFVRFITSHFDCYWLTTHCKGEAATALAYLATFYPADSIQQLAGVKPTFWETLKTEAINMASVFYWLEDAPFESERQQLAKHHVADQLLVVDLEVPDALFQLQLELRRRLALR